MAGVGGVPSRYDVEDNAAAGISLFVVLACVRVGAKSDPSLSGVNRHGFAGERLLALRK